MRNGFTLIELSIVLVIIGLIAGGVLLGKDLIKAAEIRATVTQLERYNTAYYAFQIKYNCIPGDCPRAVEFGLGTSGGPGDNGNGSETINDTIVTIGKESLDYWYHLAQAGLIESGYTGYTGQTNFQVGTDIPRTKLGKGGIYITTPWETVTETGMLGAFVGNYFWIADNIRVIAATWTEATGVFTPFENYALDAKIDDGYPSTGIMTLSVYQQSDDWRPILTSNPARPYVAMIYGATGAASNFCGANDVSPALYNVQNTSGNTNTLCIVSIKAVF